MYFIICKLSDLTKAITWLCQLQCAKLGNIMLLIIYVRSVKS